MTGRGRLLRPRALGIGLIGSGTLGAGLARRFARAGHDVRIGSRDPNRARAMGEAIACGGGSIAEVAGWAEVIVFAVPWEVIGAAAASVGDVSGAIAVDPTIAPEGSPTGADILAQALPEARVVKAFNHLGLRLIHLPPRFQDSSSGFLCGDDVEAKETIARLTRHIGLEPVDAGSLSAARELDTVASMLHRLEEEGRLAPEAALALLQPGR